MPATLLLYLQDLEEQGLAPSTIRTAVLAIAAAHRAAGAGSTETLTVHEDVKSLLRGIEREGPPQRQAAAMMPGVIAAIRATARIPRRGRGGRLETPKTAEARARVDVALALTLRDGGLRVSEVAALTWDDLERWPDGSIRLTIRRSKTDPTGEGAVVAITPACVWALDAIQPEDPEEQGSVFRLAARQIANRIKAACHAAGLSWGNVELWAGPYWPAHDPEWKEPARTRDGGSDLCNRPVPEVDRPDNAGPAAPVFGLTGEALGNRVRTAAQATGLGDGFTGHSGRIGMARRMVAAGAPNAAVQHRGRWKHGGMVGRYSCGEVAGEAPESTPRQLALWKAVQHAKLQRISLRGIARELGIACNTVRRYAYATSPPANRPRALPQESATKAISEYAD